VDREGVITGDTPARRSGGRGVRGGKRRDRRGVLRAEAIRGGWLAQEGRGERGVTVVGGVP